MKKTARILIIALIVMSALSLILSATDYSNYWTNSKEFFHGTATPFASTQTGTYGRLIWKQDFDGDNVSVGDYYYDSTYKSPYSDVDLSDNQSVYNCDGDNTNPEFSIVADPTDSTSENKVLKMYDADSSYPIYEMTFRNDVLSKPGKYTFVGKGYNAGQSFTGRFRINMNDCYEGAPTQVFSYGTSSAFGSSNYSFTVVTPEEFAASGLATTDYTADNVYAIRYLYLHVQNKKGSTTYYDDLELWYEEYADITFNIGAPDGTVASAMNAALPVTHKSYAPGTALPAPDLSGTGYDFVGWSTVKDDASKIVTSATAGTYNLYAIYEVDESEVDDGYIEELAEYEEKYFTNYQEYHGTATPFTSTTTGAYGKLIWKQDFESGYIGDYYYDASFVSPHSLGKAALSNPVYTYTADGDTSNPTFAIVDDPTGTGQGKVLSMTGRSNYPIYKMTFKGDTLSKPGKYTFVTHTNRGSETNGGNVRFLVNRCYDGAPEMGSINFTSGSFPETAYSVTVVTPEEFEASGLAVSDFTTTNVFALQYVYVFMRSFNGKTAYFDDMEMWFEEYADVTFNIDAPTSAVQSAMQTALTVTHKSFAPGTALPAPTLSGIGYDFVGWSTVQGDSSRIVTTATAGTYELYAIYRQNQTDVMDPVVTEAFAAYQSNFTSSTQYYHGVATPFEETPTGEYGRLIWKQDFESGFVGDYYYDASYDSTYAVGSATLSSPTYVYNADGDRTNPTFTVVDNPVSGGSGKVLKMYDTNSNYPIYKTIFYGDVLSKPGKYTVSVDGYNEGQSFTGRIRFNMNRCFQNASAKGASYGTSSAFGNTKYSFTVVTPEEFKASGISESVESYTNVFAMQYIFLYPQGGKSKNIYYDNYEIWYEEYADITFHLDGPTEAVTEMASALFGTTHRSFEPGTVLPTVKATGSGYSFVGWSTVKGDASKIVTTAELGTKDLYAIYEDSKGSEFGSYKDALTVYEAVMLVSKLNAEITGRTAVLEGNATFAQCFEYAKSNELLPPSEFAQSYDRYITRSEMAEMLYAALPEDVRTEINSIKGIPDVKEYHAFEEAVLALYRAGIFAGTDDEHTFSSYENLLKCDFDTLISRIIFEENRVKFSLSPEEITAIMLYDREHEITASFISAPLSYLSTLGEFPESENDLGKWVWPAMYTRGNMRKDFTVSGTLSKAELELQSDNAADFYINGNLIETKQNEDGWYLTGVTDITEYVVSGNNKMALRLYLSDEPGKFLSGMRGLVKLTYSDGTTSTVNFDSGWHAKGTSGFWGGVETGGWETQDLSVFTASRTVRYMDAHPGQLRRSCYFRNTFDSDKTVKSAYLYSSAKGIYVAYINGTRVTDARFIPGSMDGLTEYQVFDVTELINSGTNVIAAETGNGWYNCASWGTLNANVPAVMMQLEIEYTDGSTETVMTDDTWLVTASPRYEDDIQYGERYDARLEIDGWNHAKTPSGTWVNAEVAELSLKPYANQTYPAVTVQEEVRANSMKTLSDGSVLYDFRYNTSGRAKITLKNTKPGEMIVIRYCEVLNDGYPYVSTYGDVYFEQDTKPDGKSKYGARNIDTYICKGADVEEYMPEFAITGFRYVYISGYSGDYEIGTVRKVEMNTDLEQVGDIRTSNEDITKIWDAVKRSWRSNIITGPMDCPTREKNFWNGDIQVFATTASWYTDTEAFLARWTEAGRKMEYGVYGWEDEEYILPLILYRYYGNTEVIETKYPVVQNLIAKRSNGRASGSLPTSGSPYSDHQAIQKVPEDFFVGAYYCYMYKSAAEMAEILGKTEDAAKYKAEFEACRATFNSKYYLAAENDYSPKMQGGIVFPIAFGIADESTLPLLAEKLNSYVVAKDYHLTTGFMGNEYNLGILCDYGYGETAWKAITNSDHPSLLYMLTTHEGGTTTESWVGLNLSSGNSMNHYSVGCLSRWFFEHLGGITITSPGFETIQLKPYFFEEMGDCDATYMADQGLIRSAWEYVGNDVFEWTITVPEGITATVTLPDGVEFTEGEAGEYTDGTFSFVAKKDAFVPAQPAEIIYASAPALYDETYGNLVYFNNFKDTYSNLANLAVIDAGSSSVIDGKYVVKGTNLNVPSSDPNHKVNGIEIVSADGLGNILKYKDGTPITGKITIVYNAYNADSSKFTMFNVADSSTIGGDTWVGYYLDWSGKSLPVSEWSYWASKSITASDALTRYGARAGAMNKNVYFHSVAVYVKDTSSVVSLTDENGENGQSIRVTGENFVFPALLGDRVVSSWTDGTNTYAAGDSISVSAGETKTYKVKEYTDLTPLRGLNIVCIGDSLTQGDYGSNPAGTMNVKDENYPYFLKNFTGANVTNAGKCGYSAQLYYNYLPNVTSLTSNTNMVIIMLGTNNGLTDTLDADTAYDDYNDYAATQTGYYAKIIETVAEKTEGNAQIILMTPPVTTLRDQTVLETTCSVIKKAAVKYGLNVIDNYNKCGITYDNIATYMPIDKLHCGYDGYKLLAAYVASQAAGFYKSFVDSYSLNYTALETEEIGFMGRWYDKTVDGVSCKATITQGAEMYFEVSGTSNVWLRLHSTAAQAPAIAVSVDGLPLVRMITTLTGDYLIAENLSADSHKIRVIVDGFYEYQSNKWTTGDGFAVEKVVVDDGGNVTGLEPSNPVILYYGDSITEGINVLGTGSTPSVNTAIYEYPFVTSHLLGAVSYTNGFGASGVTRAGSGGVPKCLTVIDSILADTPITTPENPYAIVVNHGHNDSSATSEEFIAEYTAVLARLREKHADAPIFAVVPYAQKRVDEIKTAVDSMNDSKIFYISTADWEYTTTDGAHPNKSGAEKLGTRLAEEMKKILKAEQLRPTEEEIANHTTANLWYDGEVPYHIEDATNYATITPYIVEGSDEAVVIFPGGGYFQLSRTREGSDVAKAYNEKGVSAFVVTYRYKPYGGDAILADGQRAVQYVRYFADDFGIDPEKIAVLGFSAGGHLATMVSQHTPQANLAKDAIGETSSSPDAVLLGYAVTTLGDGTYSTMPGIFLGEENKTNAELIAKYSYSNDISKMPPAFIFYSTLDAAVNPQKNSVALATAMQNAGKTVEIHGYTDANHGVGLGKDYAEFSKWHNSSCEFLESLGF